MIKKDKTIINIRKVKKQVKGITLIALVVTIIVLLILAGVAINLTIGQNGVFNRTQKAVDTYKKSEDIEKIKMAILEAHIGENGYQDLTAKNLGSALIKDGVKSIVSDNEDGTIHILLLDYKKEYKIDSNGNLEDLNIDFDSKYKAPTSQDEERNNGIIAIGTDGKTVDMDLWSWCYDNQTGGYALNDARVINGEIDETKGYLGEFTSDGKIFGTIPQYIKNVLDDKFIPVTNLYNTFRECINLVIPPIIPVTVTQMYTTFNSCKNLKESPELPENLVNMYGLFYRLFKFN